MKIVLVKGEKALLVKRELYKGTQPFTEKVKILLFQFDKSSTFLLLHIHHFSEDP